MKVIQTEDTGRVTETKQFIKFEITDAPIITEDYTVRRRRSGNQRRTRTYKVHQVSMFKRDDEKWSMSVYVNQLKVDGTPAKKAIIAIRRFSGYDLQNNTTVKEIRAAVIKEMGLEFDQVDSWGFHMKDEDFV